MNNLPISSSCPQTAAKPATASPAIDDSSTQGQPFGDVLARQVSDASTAEDIATPNKITTKSVNEIFAHIKSKRTDDTATISASDTPSNLPADMIATIFPLAAATQQNASSPQTPITAEATTTSQSPVIAQIVVPTGVPGENPASPKRAGVSPSAAAKTDLAEKQQGVDQNIPTPNAVSVTRGTSTPSVDSKKDVAFNNMLETITAAAGAKLADKDEKSAALAAAPQPNANVQASIQSATSPIVPSGVLPVQVSINTPVSNEKWGDEFNQKITWLSNQKEQTAELHLNPPQLGPMDVVLKVSGDQATALFTSPHAAVREAVEQALPKLREMLAGSGIMLGNATVSDQTPRNRQNENENKASNSRSAIGGIADSSTIGNLNVRVSPITRHNGIVDTFA